MQNPSPSLSCRIHCAPPLQIQQSLFTPGSIPDCLLSKSEQRCSVISWDNFVTSAQKQSVHRRRFANLKCITCYLPPTWLKHLLWLSWCALRISCMSGSWVLWAFHSLAFEDKAWPKNVQLDQSTVNSEPWDHHNHAVKNVITFEDMQEDKTPWVITTLKNIFTQSAFFLIFHVFSEGTVHYMEASG